MKDQVLAKIREACPELMKECTDCANGYNVVFDVGMGDTVIECNTCCATGFIENEPNLQNVLQALNKQLEINGDNFTAYIINNYGMLGTMYDVDLPKFRVKYDLTKPFSNQPEEVFQFLAGVLIK